jgi:hypothetical protein
MEKRKVTVQKDLVFHVLNGAEIVLNMLIKEVLALEQFFPKLSAINLGPASRGFFNSTIAGKNKSPTDTTEAIAKATNNESSISTGTH